MDVVTAATTDCVGAVVVTAVTTDSGGAVVVTAATTVCAGAGAVLVIAALGNNYQPCILFKFLVLKCVE